MVGATPASPCCIVGATPASPDSLTTIRSRRRARQASPLPRFGHEDGRGRPRPYRVGRVVTHGGRGRPRPYGRGRRGSRPYAPTGPACPGGPPAPRTPAGRLIAVARVVALPRGGVRFLRL